MSAIFGKAKGWFFDKLTDLATTPDRIADKFTDPRAKKAVYIGADVVVIALPIILLLGMLAVSGHLNLSLLVDPSMTNFMMLGAVAMTTGVGVGWLLEDILGKKRSRIVGKVMAFVLPLFLFAGAACLMGAGFRHGVHPTSCGYIFFGGLALVAIGAYATGHSIAILTQKDRTVIRRKKREEERKNSIEMKEQRERKVEELREAIEESDGKKLEEKKEEESKT